MATVLIVDDDKFTRSVLESALASEPAFANLEIETVSAANGREGLQAFRAEAPAVVITDLLMPEVDGFTLCRAIRGEPRGKDVHLVIMSGIYRDMAMIHKLQDEFAAEFFAKPYQLRELTRHVATLIALDARGEDSRSIAIERPAMAAQPSSGDLSHKPLPAVLLDFLEAKASGYLTVRRGRISKVIELVVGHPLSVTSTARDEALGHFLVSSGVITEEQHKLAVKRAAEFKEKVSDALIALAIITPEEMVKRLTMQTSHKLTQSLRWPDGVWRFQPQKGRPAGPRGNPVDMVALVLGGLRQTAAWDTIPERVAELENSYLKRTPRGQALWPFVRQHLSTRLADAWMDGTTMQSLLHAGVERSELYAALEALCLCEAVAPAESVWTSGVVTPAAEPEAAAPKEGTTSDFSVEELSELSQSRRFVRPTAESTGELYAALFGDVTGSPLSLSAGDLPIELPDEELEVIDSGVIDMAELQRRAQDAPTAEEINNARRRLLKEYLRIQGMDHYGVLKVERGAAASAIEASLAERKSKLPMEWFARFDLGRDYAKLEEIHAAYDHAGRVLLDHDARASYDRSLGGDQSEPREPTLDAEIAYHAGQDLLQHGSYEGAIEHLQAAVAAAPDEAAYHAALGWAYYLKGGRTAHAADQARPHLNQGLAINPDHALSHEYKGIIDAALGTDEAEAIFHLERALDADPTRMPALRALERIWMHRGELRPLERQYRKLIYRMAGSEPELELTLWLKLAELYRVQLGEPQNARIAYQSAARLAPDDARIRAGLASLDRNVDHFSQHAEKLRRAWRQDRMSPKPGIALMRSASEAGRHDAAFMAASALVARDLADEEAEAFYQRYRPRFVIRAHQALDARLWDEVRHPNDRPELGLLFHLLAPALEAAFPLDIDDLDVDEGMEVAEEDLPEPFVRVRTYIAHMLGVRAPRVFARPDFGHQLHVGALTPPVLLAGDELLTSPERAEIAFRLGRAMTFLIPGRTFAASRPSRLLRAAVLAVFNTLESEVALPDPDGLIAQIYDHLDLLDPRALARAQKLVADITRVMPALNLSLWARALARTADRVGLLLCGDLPAAVRFTRNSSNTQVIDDLIDFALSNQCWHVRAQLGLSIDV